MRGGSGRGDCGCVADLVLLVVHFVRVPVSGVVRVAVAIVPEAVVRPAMGPPRTPATRWAVTMTVGVGTVRLILRVGTSA